MANTARRLGVYVSRGEYEAGAGPGNGWKSSQDFRRKKKINGRKTRFQALEAHFETLGLAPDASLTDVKMAYREMVKLHHPDQGGSVHDFLKLQEAYEFILTEVF